VALLEEGRLLHIGRDIFELSTQYTPFTREEEEVCCLSSSRMLTSGLYSPIHQAPVTYIRGENPEAVLISPSVNDTHYYYWSRSMERAYV